MKILVVNKFFWKKGGAERVMFELIDGYERRGHEVVSFAMASPQDEPSPQAPYFRPHVAYDDAGPLDRARAAIDAVYCADAKRRLARLLADTRPDVAHLHNFHHQLSPSIVDALREAGVPAVHTLHDYQVICPNYLLYTEGRVCERCRGGRFFEAVRHRCVRGSRLASAVACVEMTWHDTRQTLQRGIRRFVAPSRFLAGKLADFGFGRDTVRVVPNGVAPDAFPPAPAPGRGFVYAGRLSGEKGLRTAITSAGAAGVALEIVGDGPEAPTLHRLVGETGANVTFTGRLPRGNVLERIRAARAVVLPSEWYENAPIAALEALASGVPVIGAQIGGIPEIVRHGETGLLFPPGDVSALANGLRQLESDPELAFRLGRTGRDVVRREFSLDDQVDRMLEILAEVAPFASR